MKPQNEIEARQRQELEEAKHKVQTLERTIAILIAAGRVDQATVDKAKELVLSFK